MSYSRNQYYEPHSRSRSRDRKFRREYREDGYRYPTAYGEQEYAATGNYGRRTGRPPYHGAAHEMISHEAEAAKAVLAVFNLSIYTTEAELYDVFSKFGPLKKATVVLDAKTGRSRGFGFVYYESVEDAKVAHVQTNGIEIGDRRIRVDYSATEKPHDPTPGVYYGKVTYPRPGGGRGDHHGGVGGHGYGAVGGGYGAVNAAHAVGAPVQPYAAEGYYHCRACEMEARDRERWEREARRYGNGEGYYYHQERPTYAPRGRDRSAISRPPRSDYYPRGNIR